MYVLELLDWLKWYLERQEALKSSNFWQWRHLFIDIFVMLLASINFAKCRQGKSNHCSYSTQYCQTATLLIWNSGNLILVRLNYRNMIKTFQERCKGFHYFSYMKYPLEIKHFWSRLHGCVVFGSKFDLMEN